MDDLIKLKYVSLKFNFKNNQKLIFKIFNLINLKINFKNSK